MAMHTARSHRASRPRSPALALLAFGALARCATSPTEDVAVDALRDLDAEEAAFVRLLNEYRASNGLPALTPTRLLNQVAYDHSLAMGTRGFFSHTDPSGGTPYTRMVAAGYPYGAAENIAAGNGDAASTFQQWRTSPGHNANMLNGSVRAIGIGRAYVASSRYRYYWTNVFGTVVDGTAIGGPTPPDAGSTARDAGSPIPRDAGSTARDVVSPTPDVVATRPDVPAGLPFGASCATSADCASGPCVPQGARWTCSAVCVDDCGCPAGNHCVSASADGALRVCYPGARQCGAPRSDAGVAAAEAGGVSDTSPVIQGSCAVAPRRAPRPGAWVALAALGLGLGARLRRARRR